MNLPDLKQAYQEQLLRYGVDVEKAKQAAERLSLEELMMISEIWRDWSIHHSHLKSLITISDKYTDTL